MHYTDVTTENTKVLNQLNKQPESETSICLHKRWLKINVSQQETSKKSLDILLDVVSRCVASSVPILF